MKKYKPIATYNAVEDIKELFPTNRFNRGKQAEQIVNAYLMGYGSPRVCSNTEDEAIWDERDIDNDNANFFLTPNKEYGVRYTQGKMEGGIQHGYYIDIYEVIKEDETEPEFTDEQLKKLSRERRAVDDKIKQVIIKEFKEHFTEQGQGLDFFQYCPDSVYGMYESCGEIGQMFLDENLNVKVELGSEYDEPIEDFESRYFVCEDWPQLLINVRRGIKEGWEIDNE